MTDCQQCGACCRDLIIEADWVDVAREPRIAEECERLDGYGKLHGDDVRWLVACGRTLPCPFITGVNLCKIYPTRPNECVAFKPGSKMCREARKRQAKRSNA